jgi:hypothetical protein
MRLKQIGLGTQRVRLLNTNVSRHSNINSQNLLCCICKCKYFKSKKSSLFAVFDKSLSTDMLTVNQVLQKNKNFQELVNLERSAW